MGAARSLLRRAIDLLALAIGHISLSIALWSSRSRGMTVLDIDNTLSDSWPTLVDRIASESERLSGLLPLAGMQAAAHDPAVARGDTVIYLSHRPLWYWLLTFRWLRDAGFDASPPRVILVPSAAAKPGFLRRIADGSRQVDYWDDLSHGTESGVTLRYTDVIDVVSTMALTYHGLEEISAVGSASRAAGPDQ